MIPSLRRETALQSYHFSKDPAQAELYPLFKTQPSGQSCAPAAGKEHLFANLSMAYRFGGDALGISVPGGAAIGFTSLSYLPIGVAWVYDQIKNNQHQERIGDWKGATLAKVQAVDHSFFAAGSAVMAPLRGMSVVAAAAHLVPTAAFILAQSVLNYLTVALFGVSYLCLGARHSWSFGKWMQGRQWRQELLVSANPVQAVLEKMQTKIGKDQSQLRVDDYKNLALDAGEKWFETMAKEAGKQGIEWSIDNPRAAFELYVKSFPEAVDTLIGPSPAALTSEGQIIRLGKFLAVQNSYEKFEARCARKLGSQVVVALKTGETENIKEALESSWKEGALMGFKIALAILGFASVAIGVVLSGGVVVGVAYGLVALGALICVGLEDWHDLKIHWESEDFRKRDRPIIYSTLILSFLSVASLVALACLTGGAATFVIPLIFCAAWGLVSIRAAWKLHQYEQKPVDETLQETYRKSLDALARSVNEII